MFWQVGSLVLAPLCALQLGAPGQVPKLDFTGYAKTFLKDNGLDAVAESPNGHTFNELIDGPAFVRVELVELDVRFPRLGLKDGNDADHFKEAVAVLVEVEKGWSEWSRPESAAASAEDWKTLARWVKSWSRGQLLAADGGQSLYDSLGASDAVKAAVERLGAAVGTSEASASERDHGRLLFAPNRKAYIEILSVAGLLDQKDKARLWADRVLGTTIEWIGWTQLVSLEWANLPADPKQPFLGVSLTEGDKTGLAQYCAERGAAMVLRDLFHKQEVHFLEQTLATNLVIAATGKNDLRSGDWKLEYHRSGASTPAYERFVPGGNPAGGTLPPRPAGPGITTGNATEVSRFRSTQGQDHFFGPLREAQKLGAKMAAKVKDEPNREDKTAHFVLHSFSAQSDRVVSAPFLGDLAEKKPLPPNDFIDDYEEFFRAYRSGFLTWLQSDALADEAEGQKKFAALIAAHAGRNPLDPLDAVVEQVYGIPLSNADGSVDSLEWRYLAWLAKKKAP